MVIDRQATSLWQERVYHRDHGIHPWQVVGLYSWSTINLPNQRRILLLLSRWWELGRDGVRQVWVKPTAQGDMSAERVRDHAWNWQEEMDVWAWPMNAYTWGYWTERVWSQPILPHQFWFYTRLSIIWRGVSPCPTAYEQCWSPLHEVMFQGLDKT